MNNIILMQLDELLNETNDFLANAANFTAFVFNNIDNLNWCGFYFNNGRELILSVFQGKPACIKIPYSSGVCGVSFSNNKIIIVDDVHQFDGHIACDSASSSEMVIPIIYNKTVLGVLDIDSPIISRFDKDTQQLIIKLFAIFKDKTDLSKAAKYYNA